MQEQLAIVDRPPQFAAECESFSAVVVLLLGVHDDAALATLGHIHCDIRQAKQRGRITAVFRVASDADARADLDRLAVELERRIQHLDQVFAGRAAAIGSWE
jgi:hypothetical protein